jgi:hypothetical protein
MNIQTLFIRLLFIIFRMISIPLLLLLLIFDLNIAKRLLSNRYGISDMIPHLTTILIPFVVYCLHKNGYLSIPLSKITEIISGIINLQGVIFATSIAVSTFILTIFKPTEMKVKYPDKEEIIDDIVDDLRIANRITFISTLCIFFAWVLSILGIINMSVTLFLFTMAFFIWSLLAINSIIKGVFELIRAC